MMKHYLIVAMKVELSNACNMEHGYRVRQISHFVEFIQCKLWHWYSFEDDAIHYLHVVAVVRDVVNGSSYTLEKHTQDLTELQTRRRIDRISYD